MPTFKLDGKEIPFETGDTIIRAASRQGIEIPHYCWHEGLSVAGNCRMCLVEVKSDRPMMLPILKFDENKKQFLPDSKIKLVPACHTPAAEGMEVFLDKENVRKTQEMVQEMLLLNHPVDCPICDQAGECKLQDYWELHGSKYKRKRTEPVHKPKAVRFGTTIVYDAERCILCTRCVRFCEEVVGDHVLDKRERGNKSEIVLSPGRYLDNKYTLNLAQICPVGALTSVDFRFKSRAWLLRSAVSICAGCATGCSSYIDYDPRTYEVYRIRARKNMGVNKFWMCDDGFMSYKLIQKYRVKNGVIRAAEQKAVSPGDALQAAAKALSEIEGKRIAVVLSAQHASEDNAVLAQFAREVLGTEKYYLAAYGGWKGDKILRHSDNNPNRAGAIRVAGRGLAPTNELLKAAEDGTISAVVTLGPAGEEKLDQLDPLQKLSAVVSLSSNIGAFTEVASVVIPVAHYAEMDGTFVNAMKMEQRFSRALPPPDRVKPAWQTIIDLARAMGKELECGSLEDIRKRMPSAQAVEAEGSNN
ncbi:MAG: (2Fe-2S)-binding protein [Deltaproteobacteria bacterium]|nr:(2Fe-2S)-binding protein [Deltaproteobacteria bacterium]